MSREDYVRKLLEAYRTTAGTTDSILGRTESGPPSCTSAAYCGSRKLDLRALGYSTAGFRSSTPDTRGCWGPVISRHPTSPEETLLSLKRG
jgi:hypothetical protein